MGRKHERGQTLESEGRKQLNRHCKSTKEPIAETLGNERVHLHENCKIGLGSCCWTLLRPNNNYPTGSVNRVAIVEETLKKLAAALVASVFSLRKTLIKDTSIKSQIRQLLKSL